MCVLRNKKCRQSTKGKGQHTKEKRNSTKAAGTGC